MSKLFSNDNIKKEYERWEKSVEAKDVFTEDKSLTILDVLKAHFLIAEYFMLEGNGLGGLGPKNFDLLHSALYRQHVSYGGKRKYSDKFDIAATILYGLVMNHPFHDGNKRTAFLSILFYMQKLSYAPNVSHKEFEDFLVEIADHEIKKKSRYKEFEKVYDDPEIKYISWFLRKNTRNIDKKQYVITYNQLARILKNHGFDIKHPSGNYIDLIEYKKPKFKIFSSSNTERKLGKIGFPGWSKQVPKAELKKARELCNLTAENGFDSQVFYKEADALELLIAEYHQPLKNLAYR